MSQKKPLPTQTIKQGGIGVGGSSSLEGEGRGILSTMPSIPLQNLQTNQLTSLSSPSVPPRSGFDASDAHSTCRLCLSSRPKNASAIAHGASAPMLPTGRWAYRAHRRRSASHRGAIRNLSRGTRQPNVRGCELGSRS